MVFRKKSTTQNVLMIKNIVVVELFFTNESSILMRFANNPSEKNKKIKTREIIWKKISFG